MNNTMLSDDYDWFWSATADEIALAKRLPDTPLDWYEEQGARGLQWEDVPTQEWRRQISIATSILTPGIGLPPLNTTEKLSAAPHCTDINSPPMHEKSDPPPPQIQPVDTTPAKFGLGAVQQMEELGTTYSDNRYRYFERSYRSLKASNFTLPPELAQ